MLRETFLLSVLLIGVAMSIRCFSGQQTFPNGNGQVFNQQVVQSQLLVRDCGPQVTMCFKSYVRRNNGGDDSHTETRDCGDVNSGRCFQDTGCSGPGSNRICCCAGDLCNSSPKTMLLSTGLISILVARILNLF